MRTTRQLLLSLLLLFALPLTAQVSPPSGGGGGLSQALADTRYASLNSWIDGTVRFSLFASCGVNAYEVYGLGGFTLAGSRTPEPSFGRCWVQHTTTATIGNAASAIQTQNGGMPFDNLPDVTWIVSISNLATDISSARHWYVIADSSPVASATPNIQLAGFRLEGGTDTRWRAVIQKNSTATTSVLVGPTVATSTVYTLRIRFVSTSSVEVYVDGTLAATITDAAVIPTGTSSELYASITALAAQTVNMRLSQIVGTH